MAFSGIVVIFARRAFYARRSNLCAQYWIASGWKVRPVLAIPYKQGSISKPVRQNESRVTGCTCSQRDQMDRTYSPTSAIRFAGLGALAISTTVRQPVKDGGSSHTKRSCSGGNPGCTAFLRIHRAGEVTLRGPSLRIRPTGALLPPIGLIGRRAYRGAGRRRHPPAAR